MSFEKNLQVRVRRLLEGEQQARDLDELFQDLRHRSFGLKLVKDIGDFCAHRAERDQGVTCKSIQNFALLMSFHWRRDQARSMGVPIPGEVGDFLLTSLAALEIDKEEALKNELRITKGHAANLLRSAYKKVVGVRDGLPVFSENLSRKQHAVCARYFFAVPMQWAFDEDEVVEDLGNCLIKNGLLRSGDKDRLRPRTHDIAIFAMERMHSSSVPLADGTFAKLHIGREGFGENANLAVNAHIPVDVGCPDVFFMKTMFKTTCRVEKWLEPLDFGANLPPLSAITEPLEVNARGVLQILQ